jgi:imidazolonepropionase-like amidohydrolase
MTPDLILDHATVLDTRAGRLLPGRHVTVRAGRIAAIDTVRPEAPGAERLDLKGMTLMPGLCDAHVHVTAATADFAALRHWSPSYVAAHAAEILRGMLHRGFTTVRDAGGADFGLARAIEEGLLVGPRLLYCGHALSQTGGHGDMRGPGEDGLDACFCRAGLGAICDGVAEMRRACRHEIRKGASHLKLMVSGGVSSPTDRIDSTQFSEGELRAAVEEAEAANIYVIAHAYTARAINRALDCGVRSIEHGNLLDDSSIERFLAHDAFLVPTLSTYHALAEEGLANGLSPDMHRKLFDVLDAGTLAVERAYKAGVRMAYGTDLLGTMHRRQLDEFSLRGAVMPAADVIRSATCVAADLFKLTGEIGEVLVGARADLLVVDGDPLADLGVLQDPERRLKMVMKGGVRVVDRVRAES